MCRVSVDISRSQHGAAPIRESSSAVGSRDRCGHQRPILRLAVVPHRRLRRNAAHLVYKLSATIPAGGGPYIFALHAIGPRAAFFSGLAETLKGIAVSASTFYTIYSYLQALFDIDVMFAPVFVVTFGFLLLSLNIFGVQASFRMQACSTTLCVLLLLIMFFSAIPHLSYNRWVVEQNWEFTSLDSTIHAIPSAMWFYLGTEGLPLASDETIEPEKNVPLGLFLS
ncbi:Amino acid permease [Phytophthora infestans]|uniref:Amino acid permease n=1 Tax=Phytophthora infestans TaxID=4787 RepID=A0A8S9TXP7_PHYIN|nr:Amino acid permease [Phytophthora infestans]